MTQPRPAGSFCFVFVHDIGTDWRCGGEGQQSSSQSPGAARTSCQEDSSHLTEHFDTGPGHHGLPVLGLVRECGKEDQTEAEVTLNKLSENKTLQLLNVTGGFTQINSYSLDINYYIKPEL